MLITAVSGNTIRINYNTKFFADYTFSVRGSGDVLKFSGNQAAQSTRKFFAYMNEVQTVVGLFSKYRDKTCVPLEPEVGDNGRLVRRVRVQAYKIDLSFIAKRLQILGWEPFPEGGITCFKKNIPGDSKKSKTVGLTEGQVSSDLEDGVAQFQHALAEIARAVR